MNEFVFYVTEAGKTPFGNWFNGLDTTVALKVRTALARIETGKVLLRDYVNAKVGFEALAQDMNKDPKSLMRMLSAKGNPRADNLLVMVSRLKQREGVTFSVSRSKMLQS